MTDLTTAAQAELATGLAAIRRALALDPRATLPAIDGVAHAIIHAEPPRLLVTDAGALACPACGKQAHGTSEPTALGSVEWGYMHVTPVRVQRADQIVTFDGDAVETGAEPDTLTLFVQCCNTAVQLPEGWEVDWT